MRQHTTHGLIAPLAALLLLLVGCGSPQNSAESGGAATSTATADTGGTLPPAGETDLPEAVERTVSLSVQFSESGSTASRSLTRTAIGTFEEITTLHINPRRQGREALVYPAPGAALTGSGSNWSGTLDGLIVNESYTFFFSGKNISGVEIFTGQILHTGRATAATTPSRWRSTPSSTTGNSRSLPLAPRPVGSSKPNSSRNPSQAAT